MSLPPITIEVSRLSPDVAELSVRAEFPVDPGPNVEMRGRLMGPHYPGVQTIEVAYAIKPVPSDDPLIRKGKVVIPEPNFWSKERPLVYWGPAEIWDGDVLLSSQTLDIGLKMSG